MLQAVRLLTEMARTSDDRSNRGEAGSSTANSNARPSTSSSEAASVLFREIHKNGWLRRTDAKPDKDSSRCWVAFCVHDDADPRLEGFADQKQATTHNPIWSHSLRNALHLSPTLCATSKNDYEFCVNFSDDQILRLAAPTYQSMVDWVQVVTRKLTDMKVLRPKENLYSRGPERIATRDPTSPLPPPPSLGTGPSGRLQPANSASPSTSNAPTIFTFDDIAIDERISRPTSGNSRQPTRTAPPVPPSPRLAGNNAGVVATSNNDNSSYDSVFLASSAYPQGNGTENARTNNVVAASRFVVSTSSSDDGDQYAALIEYRSNSSTDNAMDQSQITATATTSSNSSTATTTTTTTTTIASSGLVTSSNNNNITTSHVTTRPQHQLRPQMTLREQQVMQLRKEMSHPAGVRLKLGRRDCKDGIAFVDVFGAVWIAGWKQKEHPLLYNVLHIGDLVLSVAGLPLTNGASSVKEILKNYTMPRVEMIVRRLPHGRVTTLARRNESEDFGLELGSSNEVLAITTNAQSLGLSAQTNPADPSADVGTTVSWTITEMNNKPLNLYECNALGRVKALGRDASVVLQPSDLICGIRKKLRAVRNYKSFVLQ